MQLQLAATRNFNGNELACYVEDKPANDFDFWVTREQIGRFLGYVDPRHAIKKIHMRNKERLDKFSTIAKTTNPQKGGTITDTPLKNVQATTVYNFKGLLEICRFSNQPVANQVIDILWDIADEIRRKGFFIAPYADCSLAALKAENDRLIQHNKILQAQNAELWKNIQDNSSFVILGKAITPVHGSVSVQEGSKLFAQNGLDIGPYRMYKLARDTKLLISRKGKLFNQPTQWAIKKGYCVLIVNIGSKCSSQFTMKGLQFLADKLAKEQLPLLSLIEGCDALHE